MVENYRPKKLSTEQSTNDRVLHLGQEFFKFGVQNVWDRILTVLKADLENNRVNFSQGVIYAGVEYKSEDDYLEAVRKYFESIFSFFPFEVISEINQGRIRNFLRTGSVSGNPLKSPDGTEIIISEISKSKFKRLIEPFLPSKGNFVFEGMIYKSPEQLFAYLTKDKTEKKIQEEIEKLTLENQEKFTNWLRLLSLGTEESKKLFKNRGENEILLDRKDFELELNFLLKDKGFSSGSGATDQPGRASLVTDLNMDGKKYWANNSESYAEFLRDISNYVYTKLSKRQEDIEKKTLIPEAAVALLPENPEKKERIDLEIDLEKMLESFMSGANPENLDKYIFEDLIEKFFRENLVSIATELEKNNTSDIANVTVVVFDNLEYTEFDKLKNAIKDKVRPLFNQKIENMEKNDNKKPNTSEDPIKGDFAKRLVTKSSPLLKEAFDKKLKNAIKDGINVTINGSKQNVTEVSFYGKPLKNEKGNNDKKENNPENDLFSAIEKLRERMDEIQKDFKNELKVKDDRIKQLEAKLKGDTEGGDAEDKEAGENGNGEAGEEDNNADDKKEKKVYKPEVLKLSDVETRIKYLKSDISNLENSKIGLWNRIMLRQEKIKAEQAREAKLLKYKLAEYEKYREALKKDKNAALPASLKDSNLLKVESESFDADDYKLAFGNRVVGDAEADFITAKLNTRLGKREAKAIKEGLNKSVAEKKKALKEFKDKIKLELQDKNITQERKDVINAELKKMRKELFDTREERANTTSIPGFKKLRAAFNRFRNPDEKFLKLDKKAWVGIGTGLLLAGTVVTGGAGLLPAAFIAKLSSVPGAVVAMSGGAKVLTPLGLKIVGAAMSGTVVGGMIGGLSGLAKSKFESKTDVSVNVREAAKKGAKTGLKYGLIGGGILAGAGEAFAGAGAGSGNVSVLNFDQVSKPNVYAMTADNLPADLKPKIAPVEVQASLDEILKRSPVQGFDMDAAKIIVPTDVVQTPDTSGLETEPGFDDLEIDGMEGKVTSVDAIEHLLKNDNFLGELYELTGNQKILELNEDQLRWLSEKISFELANGSGNADTLAEILGSSNSSSVNAAFRSMQEGVLGGERMREFADYIKDTFSTTDLNKFINQALLK